MGKLRQYIFAQLNVLFFSIFIPLFVIASVIFMIKLATYTAIIQLSMAEMGKLYLFVLPELLFYTLPLAFFVAAVLALYRLSNDNEMVVVFSLGISPAFLVRILSLPAFLLAILLLCDFLIVTPYIKTISKNFLAYKKAEAKFNLTASEFGHRFGDWMLFISKSDDKKRLYRDVVLFNKDLKEEVILIAQNAKLQNHKGNLQLQLYNGEGYAYNDETFKEMKYQTLTINDTMTKNENSYTNTQNYWNLPKPDPQDSIAIDKTNREQKYRNGVLVSNTLLSLFPLLSLFLVVALGVVHARHQKRWIYLWIFLSIVLFYAASLGLQKFLGFHTIWIVAMTWIVATYLLYRRLVGNRF
jgi:lipopolysaccharide export system permease protein